MIRYEDISAAIQVRHLQVAIDEAVRFERRVPAQAAGRMLAERGFDQAPVVDGETVLGLVRSVNLGDRVATVGDALEAIRTEHLVSADAPVAQALSWLREVPCLFVLDGRRITGFFVEADLNKQPARTYFYLLVASVEAGLARVIREWTAGDEARLLAVMPALVRDRAIEAREVARSEDVDSDLVACLLFSDILRVVGAIPEARSKLGARGTKHWHKQTGRLVGLRNAVMHPTRDLVGRGRSLDQLVALESALRALLLRLETQEPHAHRHAANATSDDDEARKATP